MGISKRLLEEVQERGYSPVEDTYACSRCIQDSSLKSYMKDYTVRGVCSYCQRPRSVVDMNEIIEHVITSFYLEFGDPDNEGLGYETAEGGYQGKVYDAFEMVYDFGPDCSDDVLETIADSMDQRLWCKNNPYHLSYNQTLMAGWKSFSKFITHTARFVFFRAENVNFSAEYDEINPIDILEAISESVLKLDLLANLDKRTTIYRVRIVDPEEHCATASKLGPPPAALANMPNRMSPVGIPMFYGALDLATAIAETFEIRCGSIKKAAVGEFFPTRKLNLVNLSEARFVPSLFDAERAHLRPYAKFMTEFLRDFTKPIERSDRAHADYVPTQVVTEYIRHIFRPEKGLRIDGIIYPSSRTGKDAVVIFGDNSSCMDRDAKDRRDTLLILNRAYDVDPIPYVQPPREKRTRK